MREIDSTLYKNRIEWSLEGEWMLLHSKMEANVKCLVQDEAVEDFQTKLGNFIQ